MTTSRYQKLSIGQKQAEGLARMREQAVSCPRCDTRVMPADLLGHISQRCPGPRTPGPGSKWIPHVEALAMLKVASLGHLTLARWVDRGEVRCRGEPAVRQYLLRDLALRVAAAIAWPVDQHAAR